MSTAAAANTTTALSTSQQLKRHTARSISECVDIYYVDEQQQHDDENDTNDNDNNNDDDDDDDDDDDFTTLSEMNDSQHTQASCSTTAATANIKFTTKTTASSLSSMAAGVINAETISGHGNLMAKAMEKRPLDLDSDHHYHHHGRCNTIDDAQNLLVNFSCTHSDAEIRSNELYNTDNESINSIESKTEISRGLVVEGNMQQTTTEDTDTTTTTPCTAATATASFDNNVNNVKANNDAFTSFFSNINAGK